MANPWLWRPGHNPYRSTAFAVLGIDPAPRGRREHAALVRRRAQRARFGSLRLFGQRVEESDVHSAEQLLREPATRALEELRTHRPHPVRLDAAAARAALEGLAPTTPPAVRVDRAVLTRLLPPLRPRTFDPVPHPQEDP